MYLKKIETQGFKSFANKMVLEFRPGIMGIVGPNGSGKSNVADAVRWVLGEQSAKQLRGSNMQDVIFAGTENRKPQGYAYVELTIDNQDHMLPVDYEDVVVSRRVYRSGESEYKMNGHLCRLKDILELFYDTGVGKEGYSIIGQGQIDKILSGKPDDRRELFDEAAGIVKYKKRKQVALKKLETEEGNLVRVTDIVREMEKRVGPLEKQAEKAKLYLGMRDELRHVDILAFHMEHGDNRRRQGETEERLAIAEQDADTTRREAEQIRAHYDELSMKLDLLEQELDSDRRALSERRVQKEKLEGQLKVLAEQLHAAQMNEQSIRDRIAQLNEQAGDKDWQIQELARRYVARQEELSSLEEQMSRGQQEVRRCEEEIADWESAISELQQRHVEALNRKAELSTGLERAGIMLEQASGRSAELFRRLTSSASDQSEMAEKITQAQESLKSVQERRKDAIRIREKAAEEQRIAENEQRDNTERMTRENQRYLTLKSHRDSLLRLTEQYEGYGQSIRRVMEKKSQYPGILGVVADLFHTEKRFELALETALGGRIQNIVTDNEQTARQMIDYLKENRLGRATFLPLSSVQGSAFPRPEAAKEKGALGIASDLVNVEPKYRGVAAYLLGRTLVVDHIDHALVIARKYRYSLNIVTLEGESLSPGGALTGGSMKHNSNLLGRRREITDMEKEMKEIQKRLDVLRRTAHQLEVRVQEAGERWTAMQKEEHASELEINTLTMELGQYQDQEANLTRGRQNWEEERERLAEQIHLWTEKKQEGEQQLADLVSDLDICEENMAEDTLKLEAARDALGRASHAMEVLRRNRTTLEQQMTYNEENQDRLASERQQLLEEAGALEEGLLGGDELERRKEQDQVRITEEIAEAETFCRTQEESIRSKSETRESLSREQRQSLEERDEKNDRLSALDRDILRIQNTLERLEEQETNLVNYIWEEYHLTPSEAEQEASFEEEISLSEARRRVSRKKAEIRELGHVDVNAIEEYKTLSAEYQFKKAQQDDLLAASEALKKIIQDLDTGMRKQFREKFALIQQEFDRVFRELFGGGKGSLELEDTKEILDAGIIINAQPPGKKLQNMMQLSGGEKALSAIALLFAIQNLKPSPFCLLDEIEAALDEPNVDRYAAYLDRLKGHTQFIVITHRRGTMEMADRLYGITMQEKGVSALVSVDLTDPTLVAEA